MEVTGPDAGFTIEARAGGIVFRFPDLATLFKVRATFQRAPLPSFGRSPRGLPETTADVWVKDRKIAAVEVGPRGFRWRPTPFAFLTRREV